MENLNHMRKIFFILFIGIFLFIQTSASEASADVQLIKNWSKFTDFGQISGISVDTVGNVYVFHRGDRDWDKNTFGEDNKLRDVKQGPIQVNTIIILHPETGNVITKTGASMFMVPHGLTVDNENNLWLTDVGLHQVYKYPPLNLSLNVTVMGQPLLSKGTAYEPGSDSNHFCKPTDVAVDKDNGDFFVSDGYCNSRIIKFDKNGNFLLWWGKSSNPQGHLTPFNLFIPHALSLAQDKKILFVADRENRRALAYHSTNGTFFKEYASDMLSPIYSVAYCPFHGGLLHALSTQLTQLNIPSTYFQGLSNAAPNQVAVYEIDSGRSLIRYFAPGFFKSAHDIALSPNGNASYIVDLEHNIWKFKIEIHDMSVKREPVKESDSKESNSVQIVPTSLKDEDFLGGTNIAIALVTLTLVIALLVFVIHIQKRKGAYRRSEMRGLILDDDEDEGINLS